jgi:hypothetical protein
MNEPFRVTVAERRARLARRHHLASEARAGSVAEVAGDLVGLHSTDPATVFLSAALRLREPSLAAVEGALYDDRTVVRMLGMRRTVFVVPLDLAPVIQESTVGPIAAAQRKLLIELLATTGVATDVQAWLDEVEAAPVAALDRRGEATAAELAKDEPRLRTQVVLARGKPYEGSQSISTRILLTLAAEGRLVRGRPLGSWISSQYRWAPIDRWLPAGLDSWTPEAAQAELVRRYLRAYGPAPVADVKWWTGWTAGDVRRALQASDVVAVDLEGTAGVALLGDLEATKPVEPWAALLPALDPSVMGWQARSWFLGPHAPTLFDRSGNAGPTVWWDGRVVGGWAQRPSGEVVVRLLEDPGAQAREAIEHAASDVERQIGDRRVTPRFRTPLEKELSAR